MSIHHELTDEMREVIEAERAKRDAPGTMPLVAELEASDNPKVSKVATQYIKGLITFHEMELKIREILA
jgi:hypothetical protein